MKGFYGEIAASMRTNKLRTFLTGFSIAWGIIILIVLLGIGTGVRNGTTQMTDAFGLSHIGTKVSLGNTSLPYAGYQKGRWLYLEPWQLDLLRKEYKDQLYGIDPVPGGFRSFKTDFGTLMGDVVTATPLSERYRTLRVIEGRSFSARELEGAERVILVSKSGISKLFKAGTDPIGEIISCNGVSYRIIGVTEDVNPFFTQLEVPLSTYKAINPNDLLRTSELQLYPKSSDPAAMASLQSRFRQSVYTLLKVDPKDNNALWMMSASDVASATSKAFDGLDTMLWLMGLGSLAIGSIGVSTIMTVSVRERMREIGIRKAIGARPKDILRMILGESILLSLIAGGIGLLLGIGLVQLIGWSAEHGTWAMQKISDFGSEPIYFYIISDPTVHLGAALGALLVLVIVGILAGIHPAQQAIKVPAVIAMRDK